MLRSALRSSSVSLLSRASHRTPLSIHRPPVLAGGYRRQPVAHARSPFHSTTPVRGSPLFVLISLLKSSTALEMARTAGRIALTFVPLLLFKNHRSRKILRTAEKQGDLGNVTKITETQKLKTQTMLFHVLVFVPIVLFSATVVAALERTPLTGRWRLIILSPEEEDEIAAQLAGPGWFRAVNDILSQEGQVHLVPATDWRYTWVKDTLRRLEENIPALQREHEMAPEWLERGPEDIPFPPPAEYPLLPRPRAHEYLRIFAEMACHRVVPPVPHTKLGPPYSLVLIDKPDASNAFSYGFGPDGGGGVVVYSGFLDYILSRTDNAPPDSPTKEKSWLSFIFGSLFSLSPPPPSHPTPTPEQTSDLAILLAHELAHLILSHHLESLSSGTVIVPAIISMVADVARAVLFPITMIFGPFVNDALAQIGKVGSGELARLGEHCSSIKQEVEADVVSARLLAHAGFDARHAVSFWEQRQGSTTMSDNLANKVLLDESNPVVRRILGSGHPVDEVRVEKLKEELSRWETERQAALRRRQDSNQ